MLFLWLKYGNGKQGDTDEGGEMKDEKDSCGVSYKAKWIEAEMIINAIGEALDGEEPSDFELSYPIVRKAFDLYATKREYR